MCWNKDISLNTFLFSSFTLLFIWYNNTYTKYKIKDFNSVWVYLFFSSFILMQLIEYFIWRNIHNEFYNKVFTTLAILLVLIAQPISSNMLIRDKQFQTNMLILYLVLFVPFIIYRFTTKDIHSTVSKLGHLKWNAIVDSKNSFSYLIMAVWLFFFLFPLFYQGAVYGFLFGIISLLVIVYNYLQDGSIESMWCWIVNSIMLYLLAYLLLYLPFVNK